MHYWPEAAGPHIYIYIDMTEGSFGVDCMHDLPEAPGPHIYMYVDMTECSLGVHCMHLTGQRLLGLTYTCTLA